MGDRVGEAVGMYLLGIHVACRASLAEASGCCAGDLELYPQTDANPREISRRHE